MPSKSPEQRRLMQAVAHNPSFAKKVGVPQSVGKEFVRADRAKGYSTQAMINRPDTAHGKLDMPYHSVQSKSKGGEMKESKGMMKKEIAFMKKKGAPKSMLKHEMAEAGMKKGGMAKKYAMGGMSNAGGASRGLARAAAMSGRTMPTTGRPMGLKNGGSASRRADGIAQRGKTKGKMLRKGGSC